MKLLILSCPRSGSKFTANLIQACGLDFGHEEIRTYGGIGFMFVSQRKYVAHGREFPAIKFEDFDIILHQVRNPLDVIRSLPPENHPFWVFAASTVGDVRNIDVLKGRLTLWMRWNLLCEKYANFTYRVEDLPKYIGNQVLSDRMNTRDGKLEYLPRPNWWQVKEVLPAAFSLARRYGYGKD